MGKSNDNEMERAVKARIREEHEHTEKSAASEVDNSVEGIRRAVEERVASEADELKTDQEKEPKLSDPFIDSCLNGNVLGDAVLYNTLHRDRVVYIKNKQEHLTFGPHSWKRDVMGRALSLVEEGPVRQYSRKYVRNAAAITDLMGRDPDNDSNSYKIARLQRQQKKLLKRIDQLRDERRRKAVLHFTHTIENPLAITGDELDQKPMRFPCGNGVIDLERGIRLDGRPKDYLSLGSTVEFRGIDEPAPLWEKSVLEILGRDEEFMDYTQRLFGYGMTGLVHEKVFPVLYGKTGWNGRSMLIETINYVMGTLAGSIPAEMLLSSGRIGSGSATSPSADIMRLQGLRMAFASETDEGHRFSASKVKWLTGKDELVGRNPYDKYLTSFQPTHKLFLMTNTKPSAPPNDRAFWERLHLIPFDISFVNREPQEPYERRAILDLDQQLRKEAPGILAWLVRGCLLWQKHGLKPPRKITEATEKYRRDEDLLADYIDECCIREPGAKCSASELYGRFVTWYHANIGVKEPSGHWFGKQLSQKYEKSKSNGKIIYHGIDLAD